MNNIPHSDMLEATRLTRAGRLTEATALLQRALPGGAGAGRWIPLRPARQSMRPPDAAGASSN